MAAHGVHVSLNSDSDELARRLYREAAKAVKYGGVSEDEALKMITLNPAWQLGIDKRVGSLEAGKDADLAIFSAHPFVARRAGRDDAGRRQRALRPRARPGRASRGRRREVRDEAAARVSRSLLAGARRSPRRGDVIAIQGGADRAPVSGAALERGTVVISGARSRPSARTSRSRPAPTVIDAAGQDRSTRA